MSHRLIVATAVAVVFAAAPAFAGPGAAPANPSKLTLREASRQIVPNMNSTRLSQRFPRDRFARDKSSQDRAMRVGIGVFGGMLAGGLLGAALDADCRCDSPGLRGFLIGAPIGALVGGILGASIGR